MGHKRLKLKDIYNEKKKIIQEALKPIENSNDLLVQIDREISKEIQRIDEYDFQERTNIKKYSCLLRHAV